MTSLTLNASGETKSNGKCLLFNWVEERATAVLDNNKPRAHIHKNGHTGILTMDLSSGVQGVTTAKAAFTPPRGHGVRQRGIRGELLEKSLLKKISEQTLAEFNPEPPNTEFCSTTKEDYRVKDFQPFLPPPQKEHDNKRDQAITFWSENHQHIQGGTAVRTRDTLFKKNATFSTPIGEHMDDKPMLYTSEN
ncbi:sperm-associated antigen 8 [Esox lucius]|uniref:Sperm-associated antigen 8 n=1 Tax=Esox lucius TaxID=8010 RepID=A0AAY5KTZ3_ESOLU|nr:sperm-associated antigen 8 [Esox lucius]XP_010876170.2 sperm-associated antigen 8 [Esox lucius]XP_010876171.2 sperm-associated antigen 8 [Esox lucius]